MNEEDELRFFIFQGHDPTRAIRSNQYSKSELDKFNVVTVGEDDWYLSINAEEKESGHKLDSLEIEEKWGLVFKNHYEITLQDVMEFYVVNEHKWLLAKIKHGFK